MVTGYNSRNSKSWADLDFESAEMEDVGKIWAYIGKSLINMREILCCVSEFNILTNLESILKLLRKLFKA